MSEMKIKDLSELQVDDFNAVINETFSCNEPSQGELALVDVIPLKKHDDPRVNKTPFTLVFNAPKEFPAQQGIYQLYHHLFGDLAIFLVPVAISENHTVFEATFT